MNACMTCASSAAQNTCLMIAQSISTQERKTKTRRVDTRIGAKAKVIISHRINDTQHTHDPSFLRAWRGLSTSACVSGITYIDQECGKNDFFTVSPATHLSEGPQPFLQFKSKLVKHSLVRDESFDNV